MRRAFDLRAIATVANKGPRRDWYSISNTKSDEAEVLIYDVIGDFFGFGVSAAEFRRELLAIDAKKVTLRINSPGGLVDEAVAMASAWRDLQAEKTTVIDGIGASAASFVGLDGKVLMAKGSRLMIHEAMSIVWGNKAEMRKEANVLEMYDNDIADFYVAKAGKTRADWLALMEAETWFSAQAAIDIGLADGMAGESKTENRYDPVFLNIFDNTPEDLRARARGTNERLDKREAEQALRDAGMPAAAAKALVSRGWDALEPEEAAARDLINKFKSYAGVNP